MTLLTVDAKLMPVLPLMLRPQLDDRADRRVRDGLGVPRRADRRAEDRGRRARPVRARRCSAYFYPDAAAVLANPNGKVIVTDGRNHIELTTETYDIIVTDPPPPIFSSGASVISSLEYYQAGHARLNPGGIMMQWVPYGATLDEFKAHVRTFRLGLPARSMVFGPGGYGLYMMGSDQPMVFDDATIREVLGRPGILADISSAYDSPAQDDRRLGRAGSTSCAGSPTTRSTRSPAPAR